MLFKEKIERKKGRSIYRIQLCSHYVYGDNRNNSCYYAYIHKINVYANNVARVISVEGGLTSEAVYRIEEYREKMQLQDLSPDYSKSDFFDGYKVQLNNEIVVDITTGYNFKIIGIPINIPIAVCAVSRSEVYYK